jgi:hypothetical protein
MINNRIWSIKRVFLILGIFINRVVIIFGTFEQKIKSTNNISILIRSLFKIYSAIIFRPTPKLKIVRNYRG